jgi:hypothetical protein
MLTGEELTVTIDPEGFGGLNLDVLHRVRNPDGLRVIHSC